MSYNSYDVLEDGYGLNLRPLSIFAAQTYGDDPCTGFMPHTLDDVVYDSVDARLTANHNTSVELYREVDTNCKGKNRKTYNFYNYCNKYTCKHKSPREISFHNTFNNHFHECCLRSRKLIATKAPSCVEKVECAANSKC